MHILQKDYVCLIFFSSQSLSFNSSNSTQFIYKIPNSIHIPNFSTKHVLEHAIDKEKIYNQRQQQHETQKQEQRIFVCFCISIYYAYSLNYLMLMGMLVFIIIHPLVSLRFIIENGVIRNVRPPLKSNSLYL